MIPFHTLKESSFIVLWEELWAKGRLCYVSQFLNDCLNVIRNQSLWKWCALLDILPNLNTEISSKKSRFPQLTPWRFDGERIKDAPGKKFWPLLEALQKLTNCKSLKNVLKTERQQEVKSLAVLLREKLKEKCVWVCAFECIIVIIFIIFSCFSPKRLKQ